MNRKRFLVAAIVAAVVTIPLFGEIIVPPRGGGGTGTGGNNNTNGYSFNGPFTTVNATNVYLATVLSNVVMTGFAPGATNAGFYVGSSGGTGTNIDVTTTLEVFGHVFVSTNLFVSNSVTVTGVGLFGSLLTAPGGAITAVASGAASLMAIDPDNKVVGGTSDPWALGFGTNHIVDLSTNTSVWQSNLTVKGNLALPFLRTNSPFYAGATGLITNEFKHFFYDTNSASRLSNLVAAASSGDVIELGAGTFNIGTQVIRPPVGVTIRGQGIDRTIISGTAGLATNGIYVMVSTNTLEDLTITAANRGTYLQSPIASDQQASPSDYTNFTMRRVKLIGESDAFDSTNTGQSDGTIEDCELISKLDSLRIIGSNAAITQRWKVRRTKIVSDLSGATEAVTVGTALAEPVVLGGAAVEFINCEIIATNAQFNTAVRVSSGYATNFILLSGCRVEAAGTNTATLYENENANGGAVKAPILVFGSSGTHSNTASASITTFLPYEASHLSAGGIKLTGGQAPNSVLRVHSTTNLVESGVNISSTTNVTGVQDLTMNRNFVVGGLSGFLGLATANQGVLVNNGLQSDSLLVTTLTTLQGGGTMAGVFTVFDGFDSTSTNVIHSLTSDASPANGDFVMTEDISTGRLKKVSLGNLPFSASGEANVNGEVSVTNSTRVGLVYGKDSITNLLRSVQAGFGAALTNQGTNVMIAVDAAIIPSQTQLTSASNALVTLSSNNVRVAAGTGGITVTPSGSGGVMTYTVNDDDAGGATSAVGGSGAIQFAEGAALAGTNLAVKFLFDRTNTIIKLLNSAPDSLNFGVNWVVSNPNGLNLGGGGTTNWTIGSATTGHLIPNGAATIDIGSSAARVRTNWITDLEASSSVILRDPSTVNSGRGTYFVHPSDWKMTNRFSLSVSNVVAGQVLRVNRTSISGGIADHVLTNEFPSTTIGNGMFLRTTNMWADGGVSSLYSNNFAANVGGLTNILATNVLDGQTMHLWFFASNGVSVNFPQFVAADYPDGAVVTPNTNGWTHVLIDRRNTITNIQVFTPGFGLLSGTGTRLTTNFVTRTITVDSLAKYDIWTNYVQTVSNLVFSFNTNRYELKNQTNVIFTNIVEEATAVGADLTVHIHNTTGVTMGLVWPAYGAQHGYYLQTNINNPVITTTTLASGAHGVASFTAFGTNIFATFTTWP